MSDHRRRGPGGARYWALPLLLVAGTAGCTSSPRYPIDLGERAGDGSVMAQQPRYPISASDAAKNAQDRASQQGYPDYAARPIAPPDREAYPAPSAAPASAEPDDDAPQPLKQNPVDSSDLPPPSPSAGPTLPTATPDDAGAQPHTISWGGGQIVFGTDSPDDAPLEVAAYHHRRHKAADADAGSDASASKPDTAAAKPSRRHRHETKPAEETDTASAAAAGSTDTPYQTVVRPGEKLSDVAERVHSSKDALTSLNDLKRPRHVKAGTVLKIPYRYSYAVQKGDTLYTISHRFNQDPDAIAKLNGLKAAPTLQPGQTLALPTDVADNGKRDHASAAGPTPVAAPDKLADAALRKAETRDRRRHRGATAETTPSAVAEAAPPAHETRRERRRRERAEAATARLAATSAPAATPSSAAAEVAADTHALRPSPEPVRSSPEPIPAIASASSATALRPSPEPVRPAETGAMAATAPEAPRTPSFVPPQTASRATVAAATGSPAYAGVRPTPAPSQSYYAGVRPAPATGGYASGRQVASLTQPRYTPGSPSGAYEPSLGRVRPTAPVVSAGPVSSSEVAAAGRGRFIWPLRGQVVSTFGVKGEGQHNDGVDIAVAPGTGVRAAAAGEVVYAGSSIPGFGNLVLVKHAGGWVTAYAHLDRIEVRMRDSVAQGEEIGQSGQTGAADRPLLHFEVRYAPDPTEKARPVDPTLVLPTG